MINNFIFSGSGGQGVISIGTFMANIFVADGKFVSFCSSYGAEMRGGAVNCEVNVSDEELLCVQNEKADYIVALNQTSFDKFVSRVKENGTIIVNSSLAKIEKTRNDIKYIFAPLTQEAVKLGNIKVANSIAFGILMKLCSNLSVDTIKKAYENSLKNRTDLLSCNINAFLLGYNYAI